MNLIKRLIAFARPISNLDRRSNYAREVIDIALPVRPLVARHQLTAALHIQLASEIDWQGPRKAATGWQGPR